MAAWLGSIPMIAILLEGGAAINHIGGRHNQTPLQFAIEDRQI